MREDIKLIIDDNKEEKKVYPQTKVKEAIKEYKRKKRIEQTKKEGFRGGSI